MVKQIGHICVVTESLEKTEKFYCDVLGLKKKFNFVTEGKITGFYLEIGKNSFIEFFKIDSLPKTEQLPIRHICLQVESIDEMSKKLLDNKIKISEKILGKDNSFQAWLEDPNGVSIELHEYTAESCQVTGKDCVIK
jgi:catechol 2,3-dioxygenase-like lactoylglutathione lyase family enzyme